MLRERWMPVRPDRGPGEGVRLVELTALAFDAASAAFGAHASAEERARAYRLPPSRARAFVHAHGALRLGPTARYSSLSYAAGRAWAAFAAVPVGLDMVAAADGRLLDNGFVEPGEVQICAGLGFPPHLAAWAAKEAAAKLTGEVGAEPEGWRLGPDLGTARRAGRERSITVRFVRPGHGFLAAVARYRQAAA